MSVEEVPLILAVGELEIVINALAEVAKDPDHDEHANLKTLLSTRPAEGVRLIPVPDACQEALATLQSFGLSGDSLWLRLLRFAKSCVLQKIFVMLYPNPSDPRLLYMLATLEQDPMVGNDEDGAWEIDLFKISDKSQETLWEMCSTVDLVKASVTGQVPDMPKGTGGGSLSATGETSKVHAFGPGVDRTGINSTMEVEFGPADGEASAACKDHGHDHKH